MSSGPSVRDVLCASGPNVRDVLCVLWSQCEGCVVCPLVPV